MGVVLISVFAAVTRDALAWNPYDTDSSRRDDPPAWTSSPGRYRTPYEPRQWGAESAPQRPTTPGALDDESQWYLPETEDRQHWSEPAPADDYGWDRFAAPDDRAERERWRDAGRGEVRGRGLRSDANDGWRGRGDWSDPGPGYDDQGPAASAPRSEWWAPRSLYDDFSQPRREQSAGYWQERDRAMWREAGPRRRDSFDERRSSGVREDRYDGYQFRHDPELTAQGAARSNGWEFRPLTGRERERVDDDGLYPRIDERDYIQRGPWRSYQDEGTAFGYHADRPNAESEAYREIR